MKTIQFVAVVREAGDIGDAPGVTLGARDLDPEMPDFEFISELQLPEEMVQELAGRLFGTVQVTIRCLSSERPVE